MDYIIKTEYMGKSLMQNCKAAVAAVESQFHCHVCFHDYDGHIIASAGPFPLCHRNNFCFHFTKQRKIFPLCCEMEAELSRARLQRDRVPFVKCCHVGVWEIVVPVFFNGSVTGALFLGPFKHVAMRPEADLILKQKKFTPCRNKALEMREELPALVERECRNLIVFAEMLAARIEKTFEAEPTQDMPYKQRAVHFIDLNFRRDIYLANLAKDLGVGEVRCCQIMKEQFGVGFSTLLTLRRLEHAKYLLRESMMKMVSVAFESGFQDASYFYRVFKKQIGMTPREYRKNGQCGNVSKENLIA